jgi:hypothetical protein
VGGVVPHPGDVRRLASTAVASPARGDRHGGRCPGCRSRRPERYRRLPAGRSARSWHPSPGDAPCLQGLLATSFPFSRTYIGVRRVRATFWAVGAPNRKPRPTPQRNSRLSSFEGC